MSLENVISTYKERTFTCDCLIVGSGAGGAVAAAELARNGFDVIVLEEGEALSTEDFKANPPSSLIPKLYRNNGAIPFFGKPIIAFSEARCVGGGTVINGGIFARPPLSVLEDWNKNLGLSKFSPDTFLSFFDEVESRLSVVAEPIGAGNKDSALLNEIGLKNHLEVELSKKNVVNCQNSNRCPTGCPTGAKKSVVFNYLADAMKSGARVMSRLRCVKIHKANKKVTGVTAMDSTGQKIKIHCSFLFMAAGVTQTPFLLRKNNLSKNAGRSIAFHTPLKFIAFFKQILNSSHGTSSKTVLEEKDFKIAPTNFRPEYVALSLISHGREAMNEALSNLDKMGIFMSLLQTSSKAHLLTTIFDQPIITSKISSDDMSLIKNAIRKTVSLLFSGGATKIYLPVKGSKAIKNQDDLSIPLEKLKAKDLEILTVHAMSSCPMGLDSKSSTVDPNGKIWNIQNAYVVDGSCLPTSTGCGPQAVIMATSLMLTRNFVGTQRA